MSAPSPVLGIRPEVATGAGSFVPSPGTPRALAAGALTGPTRGETNRQVAFEFAGARRRIDTVTFSPEALEAASLLEAEAAADPGAELSSGQAESRSIATQANPANESSGAEGDQAQDNAATPRGADGEPLSDAEVEQVRELEARDLEVRQHEQAHVAAGGPYVTSGPNYTYQRGPDGKRYAVGGNVGIDTSAEDTPEKTIAKAQVVRQAALAPAEPSAQDLRVASQASQLEQQARAELNEERREQTQAEGNAAESDSAASEAAALEAAFEPQDVR